jgi:predicted TIM-barrel fold metal-dependent hydrolase
MIIDSHVHVWPDKIAAKVVARLPDVLGYPIDATGTTAGLLSEMQAAGIDTSFIFGVAEAPRTVTATNDWLMTVDDPRLIPFGTVHPDYEQYQDEVERLRQAGFKGIKFHALFQGGRPDEERLLRICELMGADLIAYFHVGAGSKAAAESPDQIVATPERIARLLDTFPKLKVVAAHFGGHNMIEEVERHLLGRDLYLDTSWVPTLTALDPRAAAALIQRHGADKVLFGTDYPFTNQRRELAAFMRLPLSSEEQELVLGKNAARLIGL